MKDAKTILRYTRKSIERAQIAAGQTPHLPTCGAQKAVDAARARGEATVPTTIALERETNPFMRASSVAQLAERRAAKDGFRG